MTKKKLTLEEYMDATWQFMEEHCDIQKSGAMFIKFHCDNRVNFENRVTARAMGYRRGLSAEHQKMKEESDAFVKKKKEKRERYERIKKARRKWGKLYKIVKYFYE